MTSNKIIRKQALKIYLSIVVFFLIMKIFGLEKMTHLRILNFGFVFWGINSAIKNNIFKNTDNAYLNNLFIGFSTSFLAVLSVTASLIMYVMFIDGNFLIVMENSLVWGKNLSLGKVVFAILIEGLASSAICSFIIMQYWKKYKVEATVTI